MLVPLQLPPGIYKNGTNYQTKGRWSDANLIRFHEGTIQPVGGWRPATFDDPPQPVQVQGKARGSHSWRNNLTERYLAIGTHTHLFGRAGSFQALIDITPPDLLPGFADTQANTGFGGFVYGYNTFGTPRPSDSLSLASLATTWSFDNFGELLVGVHSCDGRLLYWDLNPANKAVPVVATAGTTPIENTGVIVTEERFVFLLQADGDKRRITWSDQENLFNWEQTATTLAGSFNLQTNGEIMQAVRARGQVLILTSADAHVANFLGAPLVYGFEKVGDKCGVISRNAAVSSETAVFWMGSESFYSYDGFAKPVPCEVSDYVFTRLNRVQAAKIWATFDGKYNEVTWYYPAGTEIDSYVTLNIITGVWTIGSLARTTGIDASVFQFPLRVDPNGFVYEHEVGFMHDPDNRPYLESGPVELGNGDQVYMSRYIYPDELTAAKNSVQARFTTKLYPNAGQFEKGPYTLANPTSVRFTGRQVAMRLDAVESTDWRVGTMRLEVEAGGLR